MMQIVGYFVLFVMIISGALFRRSKAVLFLMLTYMWTMIALNSDSPDYSNYEYIYENAEMLKHSFEPIYMMISLVCKQFSLSFIAFRGVIAFIIVFFLYLSVKRIGIHDNYLLSLFLLYPFAGYISSLRAAVATTIIMYACTYLLDKREKTFIKYIVLVLVAAGFQYFSLYFLTFIFLRIMSERVIYLLGICCPFIVVLFQEGVFYNVLSTFLSDDRILHWFNPEEIRYMKFVVVIIIASLQILFVVGTKLAINKVKRCEGVSNVISEGSVELWHKANLLTLCLIPLYVLQPVFIRMFNATVFLNCHIMLIAFADTSFFSIDRIKRSRGLKVSIYIPKRVTLYWFLLNGIVLASFIWFEGILEADYFMISLFYKNLLFGG